MFKDMFHYYYCKLFIYFISQIPSFPLSLIFPYNLSQKNHLYSYSPRFQMIIFFKMKFKGNFFVFLILLCLASAQEAQQQQNKNLQIPTSRVGDVIKGVNYRIDQGRSFHLVFIPSIEKKYLFFSLTSDKIYSHLQINLTLYKQGAQSPLKRCIKQEVDACYIPKEMITANQSLFAVVDSGMEELEYQLRTYWSDLQHIEPGSETKFMFSKADKRQIYHLELEGKDFKELRLVVKPETRRYAFDKVKMYLTFGKDSHPSAQKYDVKSTYLWEDAEGIYLSRKEIKDLSMNIILEGEIETVYTMRCELVNELHHDLHLNNKIYEYLQRDQSYVYHAIFKTPQGKLQHDNYVLTIAGFTGEVKFQFYKDRQCTERLQEKEPFMYMGDVQYTLTKKEIQSDLKNGLYIKASSKDRVSTFMMEIEGRSKSTIFQIHEHIYEFLPIEKETLAYFKVARYDQGNSKESLKVVFSLIQVIGKLNIQFRKCTADQGKCLGQLYKANSQRINSQYRSVGSKETHTITLQSDFWKNVNIVQKNAIILVILTNRQEKVNSFAALQFNVGNRPQFLRQNKPIQSHVLKNQLKVYKFTTTDTSIEKVRLHINKISGCFSTYVFRHEPSEQQLVSNSNKVSGALHEQTDKLTDSPIVVVIRGQDSATFSLVVQPVHKSETQMDYITLSEDVDFKIKIAPNKYQIFEIVPIMNSILYNYKSSGAVHVCILNKDNLCEDKEANFTNQGSIIKKDFRDRSLYVKLRNPSSTKSIQVNSIFHSKQERHCQLKKLGQLYKEIVKEGTCFITNIDTAQDFQVLIVRQEVGHLSYTMALCDRLLNFAIKESGEQRYVISKQQIAVNCQGHSEYSFVFVTNGGKEFNPDRPLNLHLKYLIEYTTSTITLPDGIGYHGKEVATEQPLKKFVYPILNKIDTSIVLSTEQKLYFLVQFVEAEFRNNAILDINHYDLSSPSQKFYFLQSIFLKITAQKIKEAKCRECELLIYVYSKEKVGTVVDFTIEVTQNFVKLQEAVPKTGYLVENSKAYYGYTIKNSGSLLVQVSDNNLNCAELYLSSLEYPDQNRHMQKSFDGQVIMDVSQSTKNYYITVRARKNCAYTVTASLSQGKNHVVKLERGILGYCNLAQNDIKLYTFKHLSDQAFKVISLHKYGHVEFYLNKTTPEEIMALLKKEKINLEDFSYHSDFKNRLVLDKSKPEFCKGCNYLLAVQAKKHTESSIFLGDESTKIPLSESKVINDILPKQGMVTRGQFSYFSKGILEVKVHSGKLQVELILKQQSIKKTFEKSKTLQSYNFSLTEAKNFYGSVTVIYTALEDTTIYSSRVKSADTVEQTQEGHHYLNVNANEPNYLYLSKGELTCMKGFLKRADERLFISFYSQDRQAAKKINIVGKLSNNYTEISQDTTRNIISIAFIKAANQQITEALPYELCLSHENESLSLTIMQSQETSLLPENTELLVVDKQTYDIYPEGNFLLDVFECRGSAEISYGITKKQLQKNKPKVLDMIGMPDQPHAVRLQEGFSNLLLGVKAEMALIRWIPINEQQQRGLGYYVYNAGNLRYNSAFGQIQFLVSPIKKVKKSKTTIHSVKYNLYISNNQQDLKQASLCEKYLPDSVIEYKVIYSSLTEDTFKFGIQKTRLMEKYKEAENLFFNIVADLTIKTPDETLEEYRFIYKSQELPAEVFAPNQLEQLNTMSLIIVLVLFILAVVVLTWVFAKIIVPLISRLRNSQLIEEGGVQTSKDKKQTEKEEYIEPPPSSDRQGIVNNDLVVGGTQQKM